MSQHLLSNPQSSAAREALHTRLRAPAAQETQLRDDAKVDGVGLMHASQYEEHYGDAAMPQNGGEAGPQARSARAPRTIGAPLPAIARNIGGDCPITLDSIATLRRAHHAEDGYVYAHEALKRYMRTSPLSPVTRTPMPQTRLALLGPHYRDVSDVVDENDALDAEDLLLLRIRDNIDRLQARLAPHVLALLAQDIAQLRTALYRSSASVALNMLSVYYFSKMSPDPGAHLSIVSRDYFLPVAATFLGASVTATIVHATQLRRLCRRQQQMVRAAP